MQALKAWDVFTGRKMFEFYCDLGEGVGVSALDVDKAGKRSHTHTHTKYIVHDLCFAKFDTDRQTHYFCTLPTPLRVVTGGQNGKIKVWNYNNGQCVRVLDKGDILYISVRTVQLPCDVFTLRQFL